MKSLAVKVSSFKWERYLDIYEYEHRLHYSDRHGQNMSNALWKYCPELMQEIRGTETDPFHFDKYIPAFLKWLLNRTSNEIN